MPVHQCLSCLWNLFIEWVWHAYKKSGGCFCPDIETSTKTCYLQPHTDATRPCASSTNLIRLEREERRKKKSRAMTVLAALALAIGWLFGWLCVVCVWNNGIKANIWWPTSPSTSKYGQRILICKRVRMSASNRLKRIGIDWAPSTRQLVGRWEMMRQRRQKSRQTKHVVIGISSAQTDKLQQPQTIINRQIDVP